MVDFKRHKVQLYKFYDLLTEKISDYKFWRLICRIKGGFNEPAEEVKGLKLKEINCIMKIHWFDDIETCELVERGLAELVDEQFPKSAATDEEKQFVRNTAKIIAHTI